MELSKKRFIKLLEYSYINSEDDLLLDEADDESQENVDNQPMQQDMGNQEDSGEEMSQDEMGGEEISGEETPQGEMGDQEVEGEEMTQDAMGGEDEMIGDTVGDTEMDDTMGEVEVDVTDLTAKQEDVDAKVSALSQQSETLLNTLIQLSDKIENMAQKSDAESQLLRKEIEKRNPTPVEKLQRRVVVSDPFNETPADYWKKKEAEGDYKLVDDDNEEEVFTITHPSLRGDRKSVV